MWIVLAAVAAIAVTAVCFLTDPLSDKAGAPKDGAVETVYRMAQSDDVTLCVQTPRFADNDILTAAVETAVAEKIGSLFETDSLRQVTAEQALQAATPHSFLLEYTVAHQEDAHVDIVFEGVRTGEKVTDVKYVHFVLNLETTTGREVAFDRLYRVDEALYRVFEAGLLQKYVPDSTDDGGETVIDEVCDMPAFLKGLKASAGYYWYGSENGVTIRAVVPYTRGGYVETEIPANQLYPASTGTVIREPLTLTAAQMSYTADWKDRLEQVGLTDVQFSMAYGCTFGDLYILTNYYPYVETHRELQDTVLAVETEDTVWFASVGSAVFIEQLYADDVTGDGVEDILIHADLGGSGGVGAYRSLVFEVTDSGLSLCFSHGGTVDEKDTGFRSRLSAPFQLTVENTQTGYVQTFDCSDKTAYVGTVFDSEGVPLIEEAVFDSGFSAFGTKDLDADGVCEIVTRTYVSVFTHTEYIGDGVAVFAYDREQQQFVVTKAAFDMIDDDITVYV